MADARPESNPWLNATGWFGIAITAIGLVLFFQGVQILGAAVVAGGLVMCAAAMAVTAICWHFDHRRV